MVRRPAPVPVRSKFSALEPSGDGSEPLVLRASDRGLSGSGIPTPVAGSSQKPPPTPAQGPSGSAG
eukprot:7841673-Alexandrium_andersonii.AAC.1